MNTALRLNAVTFSYPLPTFLHLSGICDIEDTLTFNVQSLREVDRKRIGLWGTNAIPTFERKDFMPTYVCYLPRDRFDTEQKARIAGAISQRHSEATGAPSYFVQVMIEETDADRYLGGTPASDHIWVRGDIRAGRTENQRTSMMIKVMQDISRITGVKEENIWMYVCNLMPTDMIEYGHVLPMPGKEKAWFVSLPETLQAYLEELGTTKNNFRL
jgi:phenylpyruvate tautomerase PptA (4-oxalocrotonate tautomerase family)